MKTIIEIGVVLLCVQYSYSTFIANCGSSLSENELKDRKFKIDDDRRNFAKEYQIANMHEVKYDTELEKQIKKMKSCDDMKHGASYRIVKTFAREPAPIELSFVHLLGRDNYEDVHPLQTSYAFCKIFGQCLKKAKDISEGIPNSLTDLFQKLMKPEIITEVIIYGNKNTFSETDFVFGPPRSQCPNGIAESGLCKGPEIPTTTTTTSTKKPTTRKVKPVDEGTKQSNQGIASTYSNHFYFFIALMMFFV